MNKLINDLIQTNNITTTLNNDKAYKSTLDANLDLFSTPIFYDKDNITRIITNAYNENRELFIKNTLMIADIQKGKGYRSLLKEILNTLLILDKRLLNKLLFPIVSLNRWDIIFSVYKKDSVIDKTIIKMIKIQLVEDLNNWKNNQNVSLLAKWLPSLRTHKKNNYLAKLLVKDLNIKEKTYRQVLKTLRDKIDIVETKLTNKKEIDFNLISSKAIFKYQNAFNRNYSETYNQFLKSKESLKTEHISYKDLVKKMYIYKHKGYLFNSKEVDKVAIINQLDLMWKAKEKVDLENVLVVADTSYSMTYKDMIYYALSLAYSAAEKSKHKFFMIFAKEVELIKLESDKLSNHMSKTRMVNGNTNIDKVFNLLLKTAKENNYSQNDLPKYLMIISDMEFDANLFNYNQTLLERQKENYQQFGYKLPKIIYWNINNRIVPILKDDKDVIIVNGFNQQMLKVLQKGLKSLLDFNPVNMMHQALKEYDKYLKALL